MYELSAKNDRLSYDKDVDKWNTKTAKDQSRDWEKVEEGNVVFFQNEKDELETGIVTTINRDQKEVKAIAGDVEGEVKEIVIKGDKIQGFLNDVITIEEFDAPLAGGFEEVDTYSYKDEKMELSIDVEKGTLPKEAKLNVEPIDTTSEEYEQAKQALESEEDILAFDFNFEQDGKTIEVDKNMKVDLDVYNIENPEQDLQIAAFNNEEDGTITTQVVADPEKENIKIEDNIAKSNFMIEGGISTLAMAVAKKPGGGTTFNELPEDKPYVAVQKTFSGITKEQIPNDFVINISGPKNTSISLEQADSVSDDGLIYNWKLENWDAGQYTVKEENKEIIGYSLTTNGDNGIFNLENAKVTAEESGKIPSCASLDFPLSKNGLLVIRLNKGAGTIVITRERLSASLRTQIEKAAINWTGKTPVYFYSIPENEGIINFTIQHANLTWDEKTEILHIEATDNWTWAIGGKYTYDSPTNADIDITNKYSKNTFNAELLKVSENDLDNTDPKGLANAKFELRKRNANGNYELVQDEQKTDENGIIKFSSLEEDVVYQILEKEAPDGYYILENSIYFKVQTENEKKELVFTDKDGKALGEDEIKNLLVKGQIIQEGPIEMKITIGNKAGQSLPNTGGAGTKLFTFSGGAIIAASSLMYGYKKRSKRNKTGKGGK